MVNKLAQKPEVLLSARSDLPLDVFSNILCRIPVKSLMRFRCVCRSWNTLIRSPYICSQHTHHFRNCIPKTKDQVLLVSHTPQWTSEKQRGADLTLFQLQETSIETEDDVIRNPSGLIRSSRLLNFSDYHFSDLDVKIYCPRIGIYCLFDGMQIALMYASTRELKVVPQQYIFQLTGTRLVEIGFDSTTNDYKMVLVRDWSESAQAAVYSLNSNSWKNIATFTWLKHAGNFSGPLIDAYIKENVHWLALENKDFILAFDMVGEVFRKIKLPGKISTGGKTITVCNEQLIVVVYKRELADVWSMQGYGNDESWTKQFSIDFGPIWNSILGYYVVIGSECSRS